MSKYFVILHTVNETVNDFSKIKHNLKLMKTRFSTPKIFTGGVDIRHWNKLSAKEKKEALSKEWFVYYSFRDEKSGKLKRMPHVKGGANRYHTKTDRFSYLETLRKALLYLLEQGLNPYEDNDLSVLNKSHEEATQQREKNSIIKEEKVVDPYDRYSIQESIDFALKMKENIMASSVFRDFSQRIKKFAKNFDSKQPMSKIDKKAVNDYLNSVLIKTSPRTRNNHRTDLSALFQVLEDNEMIKENFIKKIPVLKATVEKNKTYTPTQEKEIFDYLEKQDPLLLLYIKFISYNFLRPVEINRLLVKDIDVADKKLYVKTKNKPLKIKIIPDILLDELPDLKSLDQDNYLFTPNGFGLKWEAEENNRRDNFSKRFKTVVKDPFKLSSDYGLYSFRHTFITKLYRSIRTEKSPFEAKSILMNITGHSTMDALEKYLRDIDAELPDDYSSLFK
jgi:integrase